MARKASFFLLVASFACALSAAAEWRFVSSASEPALSAGIEHRRVVAENVADDARATLEFALFSSKAATLRVIDGSQASASLAAIMRRENCVAGVNGGYFSPEDEPIGLLISDGRVIEPLRTAKLLGGVLSVVNGRVRIQRRAEFSMKSKPSAARQCGPFLVERGRAVAGLNETRAARRTFVATLGGDRAALGYCSSVTLAELAELLAATDLKIQRALNLDGGSSSAFWFAGKDGVFSMRESKTVRDYIGIVAGK